MNHRATFHPRKANSAAARRRAHWVQPLPARPSVPLQRVGPGTRPRVDEGHVPCDTIPQAPNTSVAFHLCCGNTDEQTCSSMEQIQSALPSSRSSLQRDRHPIADAFARLQPTTNDLQQTTAQENFRIATSGRQVFKLGWVRQVNIRGPQNGTFIPLVDLRRVDHAVKSIREGGCRLSADTVGPMPAI